MITVESLTYKIDLKLNKLSSLAHQQIPLENKILALNEAQLKLVKRKMDPLNRSGLGLESYKKRYEDLEVLMERPADHPLDVTLVDENLNQWECDLTKLTPEYMFYIDSYLLADKGSCKNKIIYVNRDLTKNADVMTLLVNSNYIPSFEYEETFCSISNFKLEVYTDGTFEFTKAFVAYLRYPQEIDLVGYVKLNGEDSVTSNSELPAYLEDELVDLAVQELAMDTDNNPQVQYTMAKEQQSS